MECAYCNTMLGRNGYVLVKAAKREWMRGWKLEMKCLYYTISLLWTAIGTCGIVVIGAMLPRSMEVHDSGNVSRDSRERWLAYRAQVFRRLNRMTGNESSTDAIYLSL